MNIKVEAPIYIMRRRARCEFCGTEQEVIAVAVKDIAKEEGNRRPLPEGVGTIKLMMITGIPDEVLRAIQTAHPQYQKRSFGLADNQFMNTCLCGACFEDFYMHCEPDGVFSGCVGSGGKRLRVTELDFEGVYEFECGMFDGAGFARAPKKKKSAAVPQP
jgi:hypothetical protein